MADESFTAEKSWSSLSESLALKLAKKERSASLGGEASFSCKTVGLLPLFCVLPLWREEVDSAFDR
jgi:hypothetical protein